MKAVDYKEVKESFVGMKELSDRYDYITRLKEFNDELDRQSNKSFIAVGISAILLAVAMAILAFTCHII